VQKKETADTHDFAMILRHVLVYLAMLDGSADLHVENGELEFNGFGIGSRHGSSRVTAGLEDG